MHVIALLTLYLFYLLVLFFCVVLCCFVVFVFAIFAFSFLNCSSTRRRRSTVKASRAALEAAVKTVVGVTQLARAARKTALEVRATRSFQRMV